MTLTEAWSWYEEQQAGLGDRFLDAVRAALDNVAQWPNSGTSAIEDPDGGIVERRVATWTFPYAIRYRTIGESIVVMAIYHQRRHPDFGTDRTPDHALGPSATAEET
ncbi:MAG: type II toxin-antitoxin system RelE/ParE family toxin [Candidatus Microthrix sp.]|nr:type II toxin-antitoxin system RelE/ParE family toxin [Candidatus Microthrix sp.]MBK7020126.1 type II toxin-antitoxin system RelE/ParE family toxin [Candidatus Microthrix sp.]